MAAASAEDTSATNEGELTNSKPNQLANTSMQDGGVSYFHRFLGHGRLSQELPYVELSRQDSNLEVDPVRNDTGNDSMADNSLGHSHITYSKSSSKSRLVLVPLCLLLLVTCIILAVLLAVKLVNDSKSISGGDTSPIKQRICNSADCLTIAGAIARNMNQSVSPCEDFFEFSCGGWIRDNPIPPAENEYSYFHKLKTQNDEKLRNLLENVGKNDLHAVQAAKEYYKSCVNEDDIEAAGNQTILEVIKDFGSWGFDPAWDESTWNYRDVLLKMQKQTSETPLFSILVMYDPRNSSRYSIELYPAEFELIPSMYNSTKMTVPYLKYMTEIAVLLGGDKNTAQADMAKVLQLEHDIANILPPAAETYSGRYSTTPLKDLIKAAADFPWVDHLNAVFDDKKTIGENEEIIFSSPAFYGRLINLIEDRVKNDKKTVANFMMWQLVRTLVPYLSKPFRLAQQNFNMNISGIKESMARWLMCIQDCGTATNFGFALGNLFVKNEFHELDKIYALDMTKDIRQAFIDNVDELDWLDNPTRDKIEEKANSMIDKVGYPNLVWNETKLELFYAGLEVHHKKYLLNRLNCSKWHRKLELNKLRKQTDKDEWMNPPHEVNAFYLPWRNEMNIAAGIMQIPFYYGRKAPRAVNYGALGMVLAHELTHGFDMNGRKFNKFGEITESWWSNSTIKRFRDKADCLRKQYSKYILNDDGLCLDGNLTLSENIADNGGVKASFKAYKAFEKKVGVEDLLPGLNKTNDQLIFITFAQMWCSRFSEYQILRRAEADTHSLPRYRVIGVVSNIPEFSKAFNCPKGSPMNPQKKCAVW